MASPPPRNAPSLPTSAPPNNASTAPANSAPNPLAATVASLMIKFIRACVSYAFGTLGPLDLFLLLLMWVFFIGASLILISGGPSEKHKYKETTAIACYVSWPIIILLCHDIIRRRRAWRNFWANRWDQYTLGMMLIVYVQYAFAFATKSVEEKWFMEIETHNQNLLSSVGGDFKAALPQLKEPTAHLLYFYGFVAMGIQVVVVAVDAQVGFGFRTGMLLQQVVNLMDYKDKDPPFEVTIKGLKLQFGWTQIPIVLFLGLFPVFMGVLRGLCPLPEDENQDGGRGKNDVRRPLIRQRRMVRRSLELGPYERSRSLNDVGNITWSPSSRLSYYNPLPSPPPQPSEMAPSLRHRHPHEESEILPSGSSRLPPPPAFASSSKPPLPRDSSYPQPSDQTKPKRGRGGFRGRLSQIRKTFTHHGGNGSR